MDENTNFWVDFDLWWCGEPRSSMLFAVLPEILLRSDLYLIAKFTVVVLVFFLVSVGILRCNACFTYSKLSLSALN